MHHNTIKWCKGGPKRMIYSLFFFFGLSYFLEESFFLLPFGLSHETLMVALSHKTQMITQRHPGMLIKEVRIQVELTNLFDWLEVEASHIGSCREKFTNKRHGLDVKTGTNFIRSYVWTQ